MERSYADFKARCKDLDLGIFEDEGEDPFTLTQEEQPGGPLKGLLVAS